MPQTWRKNSKSSASPSAPTRERDLELPHASGTATLDALQNRPQREVDHADHRLSIPLAHFVREGVDDLVELLFRDCKALSGGAEDIQVPRPARQHRRTPRRKIASANRPLSSQGMQQVAMMQLG